jgi:hypothetical protein
MKKLFLLATFIFYSSFAYAQPSTISYQGVLTDNAGVLINGERNLIIKVYNAAINGELLATDTHNATTITNGLFNIELSISSVDFSKELWLEISVDGFTLTPRVKFNATGYALAGKATSLQISNGAASGKVLTSDANGNASWTSPQVGLANFSESRNTSSPNNVIPAHSLTATGAETNIDMVISPKGTGALTASIANGSISGGNKRGINAVDLQTFRNSVFNIASGDYSTISGGSDNTASGLISTVSGGGSNTASGLASTVSGGGENTASELGATVSGGSFNVASGVNSTVSGGSSNTASGVNSTVSGGSSNTASGVNSTVFGGASNIANGDYSSVIGGNTNNAQSLGETVAGIFATVGAGSATNYVATDRLFVVGNGADEDHRSDAIKIMKNAHVTIGDNGYDGVLKLYSEQGDNDHYVQFQPHAAMTQDVTYTLPSNDGDSDQFLKTDGNGNLSWATVNSGSSSNPTFTGPDRTDIGNISAGTALTQLGSFTMNSNGFATVTAYSERTNISRTIYITDSSNNIIASSASVGTNLLNNSDIGVSATLSPGIYKIQAASASTVVFTGFNIRKLEF